MKKILILFIILMITSCGNEEVNRLTKLNNELKEKLFEKEQQNMAKNSDSEKINFIKRVTSNFKAIIKTNYGNMTCELYNQDAPIHVFTFITRAESGFYNGTKFHRIMKGFMIQGGSPSSKDAINYNDGMGGPLLNIPFEINANKHVYGALSAANIGNPQAGDGSQFFVMHGEANWLDGKHTVFGQLVQGKDVLEKIANVRVYEEGDQRKDVTKKMPLKPVIIQSIEIKR